MRSTLTKTEAMLSMAFLATLCAALAAPVVLESAHLHELAGRRMAFGLLDGLGVLASAPLAIAALAGLLALWRAPLRLVTNMQRAMALLFFGGLWLLALGSATYHLDPNHANLALQRYCMAAVVAGVLGLAAAGRVSERAGAALGVATLLAGLAAVATWTRTGNVLPWTLLQFAGAVVLWFLALQQPLLRALPVQWALVLLTCAAARLLQANDHAVFAATGQLVSGHALASLAAAMAAAPVVCAISRAAQHRRVQANMPFGDARIFAA